MIDILYYYVGAYFTISIFSFFLYFSARDYYSVNPTKKKSLVTIILSLTWIVSIPIMGAYAIFKDIYTWWTTLPDE